MKVKENGIVIDYCKFHSFMGSEYEARGCASCIVEDTPLTTNTD